MNNAVKFKLISLNSRAAPILGIGIGQIPDDIGISQVHYTSTNFAVSAVLSIKQFFQSCPAHKVKINFDYTF